MFFRHLKPRGKMLLSQVVGPDSVHIMVGDVFARPFDRRSHLIGIANVGTRAVGIVSRDINAIGKVLAQRIVRGLRHARGERPHRGADGQETLVAVHGETARRGPTRCHFMPRHVAPNGVPPTRFSGSNHPNPFMMLSIGDSRLCTTYGPRVQAGF